MINPDGLFAAPSIDAAGGAWFDSADGWARLKKLGLADNFRERFARALRAAIEEAKK